MRGNIIDREMKVTFLESSQKTASVEKKIYVSSSIRRELTKTSFAFMDATAPKIVGFQLWLHIWNEKAKTKNSSSNLHIKISIFLPLKKYLMFSLLFAFLTFSFINNENQCHHQTQHSPKPLSSRNELKILVITPQKTDFSLAHLPQNDGMLFCLYGHMFLIWCVCYATWKFQTEQIYTQKRRYS